MHRGLIALAAILGFVIAFLGVVAIGLSQNTSPECDGVCVDIFPVLFPLALFVGVAAAVATGLAASSLLRRSRGARLE